jgi:hypothetical protein
MGYWIGAIGTILAAVVTAVAVVLVGLKDKATRQLTADCRLAVRDLRRFRELEDLYAAELARLKGKKATATSVKLEMRGRLQTPIADYGEPARINRLLGRLDNT